MNPFKKKYYYFRKKEIFLKLKTQLLAPGISCIFFNRHFRNERHENHIRSTWHIFQSLPSSIFHHDPRLPSNQAPADLVDYKENLDKWLAPTWDWQRNLQFKNNGKKRKPDQGKEVVCIALETVTQQWVWKMIRRKSSCFSRKELATRWYFFIWAMLMYQLDVQGKFIIFCFKIWVDFVNIFYKFSVFLIKVFLPHLVSVITIFIFLSAVVTELLLSGYSNKNRHSYY